MSNKYYVVQTRSGSNYLVVQKPGIFKSGWYVVISFENYELIRYLGGDKNIAEAEIKSINDFLGKGIFYGTGSNTTSVVKIIELKQVV